MTYWLLKWFTNIMLQLLWHHKGLQPAANAIWKVKVRMNFSRNVVIISNKNKKPKANRTNQNRSEFCHCELFLFSPQDLKTSRGLYDEMKKAAGNNARQVRRDWTLCSGHLEPAEGLLLRLQVIDWVLEKAAKTWWQSSLGLAREVNGATAFSKKRLFC